MFCLGKKKSWVGVRHGVVRDDRLRESLIGMVTATMGQIAWLSHRILVLGMIGKGNILRDTPVENWVFLSLAISRKITHL